jgi:hypothetical protein
MYLQSAHLGRPAGLLQSLFSQLSRLTIEGTTRAMVMKEEGQTRTGLCRGMGNRMIHGFETFVFVLTS